MKKMSVVIVFALIAFAFSQSGALAVNKNQAAKDAREQAKQALVEKVAESKDTMLEQRETLREELKEGKTDVMQKIGELHAIRLENRFNFYYNRLKGISDRVNAQINTPEEGITADKLAKAKSLMTQASAKLEEVKTKGAKAVAAFRAVKGADLAAQRKEVFAARDEAKAAIQAFKDSNKLMKDAARELRVIGKGKMVKGSAEPKSSKEPKASREPKASDSANKPEKSPKVEGNNGNNGNKGNKPNIPVSSYRPKFESAGPIVPPPAN